MRHRAPTGQRVQSRREAARTAEEVPMSTPTSRRKLPHLTAEITPPHGGKWARQPPSFLGSIFLKSPKTLTRIAGVAVAPRLRDSERGSRRSDRTAQEKAVADALWYNAPAGKGAQQP